MSEDYEPFSELFQVKNPGHAKSYVQIIKAKRFSLWYDWIEDDLISQTEFAWRDVNHRIAEVSTNPEYRIFSRVRGYVERFEVGLGPELIQFASQIRQLARGAALQLDTGEDQLFALAKTFGQLDPWVIEALLIADRRLSDYCVKREFWDQLLVDIGFTKQKLIANLKSFYLESRKRGDENSPHFVREHVDLNQRMESLRGHALRIAEFHDLLDGDRVELQDVISDQVGVFTVKLTKDGINMI